LQQGSLQLMDMQRLRWLHACRCPQHHLVQPAPEQTCSRLNKHPAELEQTPNHIAGCCASRAWHCSKATRDTLPLHNPECESDINCLFKSQLLRLGAAAAAIVTGTWLGCPVIAMLSRSCKKPMYCTKRPVVPASTTKSDSHQPFKARCWRHMTLAMYPAAVMRHDMGYNSSCFVQNRSTRHIQVTVCDWCQHRSPKVCCCSRSNIVAPSTAPSKGLQ
jgi:hypothetical protein